jgi:hypothetical protein
MKQLQNIVSFFLFLGVLFFSCKKDAPAEPSVDFSYNYFPNEIGRYVVYQVDSIAQDDKSNKHDTTQYLLKELIASSFLDNSNRPTLRIERYYKFYKKNIPYDSMNWIGPRVWFANKTTYTTEKVEENIRYLKLAFPMSKGKKWNGNVYNTFGRKEYEVMSLDQPETINAIDFDSVATIKQLKKIDFIEYIYEAEKYVRNVGLVYKVRDSLYDGGTVDTIGYMYTQKIISYGK